jgi:protein TonB
MKKIPDFDDLIFESRNKEYGAYKLRKEYKYVLAISTFIGIFIACCAALIPFYIEKKSADRIIAGGQRSIQVQMDEFIPPEEKLILPPPPPPGLVQAKEIRYLSPEVVDTVITTERTLVSTDEAIAYAGDTTIVEPVGGYGDILSEGEGGSEIEEAFIIVEEMPTFMGGDINSFRQWVQKRTSYPALAIENNITGKVILTFVIEKDGSVSSITVVKGVHPLLDDEAIRVISLSPKWRPGLQRGHAVRVRYTMPLIFQFN